MFWIYFFVLWQILCYLFEIPVYLLPKPTDIILSFYTNHIIILNNTLPFMKEVFISLILSVILGYGLALVLSFFDSFEDNVSSFILALQSIPRIIIGPFIIIWLGFTLSSKVFLAVFIGFLAIFINSYRGIKNVDSEIIDVAKTYTKSKLKILYKIRIPNSIPSFLTGLKISTPSVIGGVVLGEWFIGGAGLGYLSFAASSTFDTPLALAAVTVISLICISLYKIITIGEKCL